MVRNKVEEVGHINISQIYDLKLVSIILKNQINLNDIYTWLFILQKQLFIF